MAKTNETKTDDAASTLWRVNYSYTVNCQLRSGSYILPAENAVEAKSQAHKLLTERFTNTGNYFKVGSVKPF